MNIFEKFNKGSKFDVAFPENLQYFKLANLMEEQNVRELRVLGVYINRSQFGESCFALCEKFHNNDNENCFGVNLPSNQLEAVKEIISRDDMVQAINSGETMFRLYKYKSSRDGKEYYNVHWICDVKK